ncbi:MAG: hypothetical protein KF882_00405 [Bacteroidia bacterium]|nr:hypothetical protein [Bacteroidia bacterium]MCO5253137.1 hypothetical protein [Bacteroidota bacterium]
MNIRLHTSWILGMLGLIVLVQSCKKMQYGCTAPDSANYCADCDEDDGTCTYKGKVDFWFNQATMDSMYKNWGGLEMVFFYIGKKRIPYFFDLAYPPDPMESAPDCKSVGIVSVSVDLGKEKSLPVTFILRTGWGILVWEYPIEVKANACIQQQLVWRGEGFKFKAFK